MKLLQSMSTGALELCTAGDISKDEEKMKEKMGTIGYEKWEIVWKKVMFRPVKNRCVHHGLSVWPKTKVIR